jgi:hypothetical protein
MSKTILIIFVIFSYSVLIKSQTFEGLIQYQSSHQIHVNVSEIFIKDNKCKSQFYIDNIPLTSYSLCIGRDWYIVSDLNGLIKKEKNKTEKGNIKLIKNKKKEFILGYACTLYKEERNTPYGKDIMIYYIADSLKANNQNGSKIVKNGRIVLKSVQKTEHGIYENEAVEIKEMKLDDNLFKLPDYPIKEVDFGRLSKQFTGY